jgi:pimeloyl-ACP methyl ester carboxylesterase
MTSDVLYLLPGLLCDADSWRDVAERLAPEWEVVTPGFFEQDSLEGMAQWVLDRAPPRFSVAGHSMGGRAAMILMRLAPERIQRLALVDTNFVPATPDEAPKRQVLIDAMRARGMPALSELWLPPMVGKSGRADPAMMARMAAMVERCPPELFERQIKALLGRPEIFSVYATIRCPTAVICGREDEWSPVEAHVAMAEAIAGAELTVIEDCGHMAPVEQPQAVADALARLMRRPAGDPA